MEKFLAEYQFYIVLGALSLAFLFFAVFLRTEKGRWVRSFLRESKEELRKVTWPDRDEVTSFTGVVVVTVVVVSVFLWLVDSGLMMLVKVVVE